MKSLFFTLSMLSYMLPIYAQTQPNGSNDHFNQKALESLQNNQVANLDDLPQVFYDYYVVKEDSRLRARMNLFEHFGINCDNNFCNEGKALIQLLNRNLLEELLPNDTLVVPTQFGLDLRSYTPFPRYYLGAKDFDKIVILDKEIQAFAAYEKGELRRWGIINTGSESTNTPTGRFNVNWKALTKISSKSPGLVNPKESDEMWEMTWVMNIHERRGIHMHQYAMPTGGPASHGCVRINDADAKWLYDWTDTWQTNKGADIEDCDKDCRITKQGTMVIVLGPDPNGKARPFINKPRYPILRMVDLPTNPYSVSPGTDQQRAFDRLRAGATPTPAATTPRTTSTPRASTTRNTTSTRTRTTPARTTRTTPPKKRN